MKSGEDHSMPRTAEVVTRVETHKNSVEKNHLFRVIGSALEEAI